MKKILLLLITTLSLIAASGTACNISAHTSEITQQKIVYITRTGSKYHRGDCRYLRQSKMQTTRKDATRNGYTACSVCKP